MKHRIFESLVNERGFDLFVLEAGGPEMERLDDFVTSGQGDPEQLLIGLGPWPWRTRELASLFRWIREHNETAGARPIRVAGIDMQVPGAASTAVLTFLRAVDPAAQQQADAALACLRPYATHAEINALYHRYSQQSPEQQSACRAGLQAIHDRILELRGKVAQGTSASEAMRALAGARTLVQFEQILRFQGLRDRFMADNLTWLLEQRYPGSRAVVWSHNGHVVRQPNRLGGALERRLGAEAVLHLGFTFYSGAFNAIEKKKNGPVGGLRTFQAEPPPAESWEALLHTAGLPRGLLDLGARGSRIPAWADRPHPLRRIGAIYGSDPQTSQVMTDLRRELDFLIYLEQTTPSELLPSDRSSSP